MTSASLNGVALSTISEVELLRPRRPFPVPRHKAVEIPGRAGSIIFPEELGDRIVTLDLHLLAATPTARRTAVEELMNWATVGAVSALIIDDQPDRYEEAIIDGSTDPNEWWSAANVSLPFRCGAYVLALSTSTENLVAGSNPDSDTFSITDNVDARPVIEITPTGGTVTGFTLTVNGFALSWEGTLIAGDTLTVNSISETITAGVSIDVNVTGAYDPSAVRMSDASGFFPLLTPGSNAWSFSWTGTATSVALDLEWRERFLT
jgi:predicted phage tail component-like protein